MTRFGGPGRGLRRYGVRAVIRPLPLRHAMTATEFPVGVFPLKGT